MSEAITILRPALGDGVDEQGNPVPAPDIVITSTGWAVAPLTAAEDSLAQGQEVIEGFTLYRRNAWVEIRPDDRVRVRGNVYAVVSPASQWQNLENVERGTVVTVKRVG